MAPVVSRRHLAAKVRFQSLASPCWIRGGQRYTEQVFFSDYFSFPRHYLSTGAPCSLIHSLNTYSIPAIQAFVVVCK